MKNKKFIILQIYFYICSIINFILMEDKNEQDKNEEEFSISNLIQ